MALPSRTISFVDVGHGNCAVIHQPSGTFVIDAGPQSYLLDFLEKENISRIDSMIVSHADYDHLSGLLAVLSQNIPIENIYINPDGMKDSRLWEDVVYELEAHQHAGKLKVHSIAESKLQSAALGVVELEILAPGTAMHLLGVGNSTKSGGRITANTNSVVIRVLNKNNPLALLPGDMDIEGFEDILRRKLELKAKYLIFPHHGGKSGKTDLLDFAMRLGNVVQPSTVLFSISRNKFRNPRIEVLEGIHKVIPNANIACTQLSKNCADSDYSGPLNHLVDTYSQGLENNNCCAGTVVIDLDDPNFENSARKKHIQFIQSNISTRLCGPFH